MAARRIFVELVTAGFSIFDSFVEDCDKILHAGAVNYDEVFHEESIGGVPAAVENSGVWIEQVFDLFVVYLSEGGFDGEFLATVLRSFPE